MKKENKKANILLIIAGFLMIISSSINYSLNGDEISLGIFTFSGIGFILLGIKNTQTPENAKRVHKHSMLFFMIAVMLFLYWFAIAKLGIQL